MTNAKPRYQDTIKVDHIQNDRYGLYWTHSEGGAFEYICTVYGFENAVRVANGIAHEQVEYVTHPAFPSDYETNRSV